MELLRGTMVRHNAVVYRDDESASAFTPRFDDDRWKEYVPVRQWGTVSVQERLPPGASTVLINPAHTYKDLYLPLDTRQKRLFEAIDGTRSLGDIAGNGKDDGTTRALFERLWWYDQVVLDLSQRTRIDESPSAV